MKIATILAITAGCALAQPHITSGEALSLPTIDVPRLLADHNIKSAEAFPDSLRMFRNANAALPVALADMGDAVFCTKQRPITDQCVAKFRTSVKKFHTEQFDLRWSYRHATEVLHAIELDILARHIAAEKERRFEFSLPEEIAVQRYLARQQEYLDRSFGAAEKQWHETWRRAEKVLDNRKFRK